MDSKTCSKCGILKTLDCFYKRKAGKDGLQAKCKDCQRVTDRTARARWAKKNRSKLNKAHKKWADQNPEYILWFHGKQRAKKKGVPFTITINDIVIPKFCSYLNTELVRVGKKHKANAPSIDEIITGKGYIPGNIQIISEKANRMKNNASIPELLSFSQAIIKQFGEHANTGIDAGKSCVTASN